MGGFNFFYDWYSASIDDRLDNFWSLCKSEFAGGGFGIGKPMLGYTSCDKFMLANGEHVFSVYYGGESQGNRLFVVGTGSNAVLTADFLKRRYPGHHLVRADVAVDFNESGAWDSMYGFMIGLADKYGLQKSYIGEPGKEVGECERGRTLYIGSRRSEFFWRLYEKGKKDNPDQPDWVRLEFECKPSNKNKLLRCVLAGVTPSDLFSYVCVGQDIKNALGCEILPLSPVLNPPRSRTDFDRALLHVKKQYKATFTELMERCEGDCMRFASELMGFSAK